MEIRYSSDPDNVKKYTTQQLRKEFLVDNLFEKDKVSMVYSHIDRIIIGSAVPHSQALSLEGSKELGTSFFLERRELGIINIGGAGYVISDDNHYDLKTNDCLYIGKGTKNIVFGSQNKNNPAKLYLNSTPAHTSYKTVKINIDSAKKVPAGSDEECNKRMIHQFIHPDVLQTCQLLMGMTVLSPGSVWNTMPCHTHDRRMEVYLYFNMKPDSAVFHYMGEPSETRHIVVRNEQAVISPSWSIHSGAGTSNYAFIWGMAGENQTFSDMDMVSINDLY